jgi:hypothetical protein
MGSGPKTYSLLPKTSAMGSGTITLSVLKPDPMPGRTGGTPIPTERQMHGPAGTLVPTEDGEGRTRCCPYPRPGD